ncbi:glutamate--tRNA ligase [Azospirillum sp. ST 5-10]|uniref:glutamate--tRNA ligase n=1 Tax=unclassified Azospirillum TaxID=2630922 RepID=UPI003F49F2B9
MTVRTRVAPSPTGDPHVGTAYMALMNYCFAKSQGGQFLLRIEDTDRVRSTAASERMILDALRWFGVTWDEGPDVGGPHGPYRQSERSAIYREHCDHLLEQGHAFRCFCTPERLETMRRAQRAQGQRQMYDGRCLNLSQEEIADKLAAGVPHVVRMKVPKSGACTVHDMKRGPIEIEWSTVDMQVLMKSDGLPTYHLANVVDDHLMGITHVLRGEEWLPSAPKHVLLYQYFGWEMPKLCHMPLLRNPDKTKLSKRRNPTSILYYQRAGYLPEALVNLLGLMALSVPEGDEIRSLDEIVAQFDVDNISLGGPVFDIPKLNWLNGRYIRERLTLDQFMAKVAEWAVNPAYMRPIADMAQTRIEKFSDLGRLVSFFFAGSVDYAPEALAAGKIKGDDLRRMLQMTLWRFDTLPEWEAPAIEAAMRALCDGMGFKFRDFIKPFYVAVSGSAQSVPVIQSMELLGRDLTRERLRQALTRLGGVSNAELEAWKSAEPAEAADGADAG